MQPCPQCSSEFAYFDGYNHICPDCAFEWNDADAAEEGEDEAVKDAHGNVLNDGDAVILIKDLKVKGSSIVLKKGTKVKNIRIGEGDHAVDGKIDGQVFSLKQEFLKKA